MQVIRSGVSEFAQDIPVDLLEGAARDADHLSMLRELSLRSYIIVPIQGRRSVRGAITFVYAESGRLYEERDIDFVEEVARRAGVAIENAELVRNLERTRTELEEQTTELEMQSEELLMQTSHLEQQSNELETSMEELQATADRLSRSEALLAEAQSSARLGSWEWDMTTGAVVWTDELYRLYGYRPGEIEVDFAKYIERIHADDRAVVQAAIEGALAENGTFVFEHRVVHPDGTERFLHCRGRVVVDEHGRPVRMTGSAQDITERKQVLDEIKRAQEELGRANRTKSDFLASMSHELRTPLNAIGGYVELLSLGIHGPVTPQQHAALERIRASQEHLLTLINDILHFAQLEAGHLEYRPKTSPWTISSRAWSACSRRSCEPSAAHVRPRAADEPLVARADPREACSRCCSTCSATRSSSPTPAAASTLSSEARRRRRARSRRGHRHRHPRRSARRDLRSLRAGRENARRHARRHRPRPRHQPRPRARHGRRPHRRERAGSRQHLHARAAAGVGSRSPGPGPCTCTCHLPANP